MEDDRLHRREQSLLLKLYDLREETVDQRQNPVLATHFSLGLFVEHS
jgi:hypothetical protein